MSNLHEDWLIPLISPVYSILQLLQRVEICCIYNERHELI